MTKPELTIAIATLGRESLFMTLDSIIKNKGSTRIEIIVIGVISRNFKDIMNSYLKHDYIKLISKNFSSGDLSRKRNLALREAKADIVAFCDDDVKITPNWIKEGIDSFKRYDNLGIASGPGINPSEGNTLNIVLGDTMSSIAAGKPASRYKIGNREILDARGDKIIGCNFFVLKKIAGEIGYFNPGMIPGEEIDFAVRAIRHNYKVLINPKIYLFHFARPTIKKFAIQNFRFGYSRIRMMKKGMQADLLYLTPLAWLSLLIVLGIFSFFSRIMLYVLIFYLGIYLIFLLTASTLSIIQNGRVINILIAFIIPIMHTAYAVGELKELLLPGTDFRSS